MTPCISQVTTLSSSFAEDIENYPAAGCHAIEVWLTKLEQHLETVSATATHQYLEDHGIEVPAAAYQGGLLLSEGEKRSAHFDHFKRRLELCQSFGIRTLVLAADLAPTIDREVLGRAQASLTCVGQLAAAFGVQIALEFRGVDSFCSTLDTAISLVDMSREPNVGICLDVFHYYKGPSKLEDLDRLTPKNLFHVQVSDVAGIPRELMTDADRVMPGDGDFRLDTLICKLRSIEYCGPVSLELLNPQLWAMNPKQVLGIGQSSLRRLLALPA